MRDGWVTGKIAQLARVKSGFAFKSSQWTDEGVPVVKIGNVKRGRLDLDGCSFVTEKDASQSGFLLADGDILMGLTGYVGEVAKVRNLGPLVLNQRVGKFYPTRDCDPNFLFFLVSNEEFRQRVEAASHGSAQANVSPSAIERFEVLIPPLPEQRAIAATLGALDEKIDLNRKMNATLEAMARVLFRDWFVDFGPTRAKMEGNTPYLSPDLLSLFPDRLDDESKPEGWAYEPLLDLAEWVNGAAYKKMHFSDAPDALPVIKIAELKSGVTGSTQRTATDLGPRYLINDGELLFSWSGNPDTSIDTFLWTGGTAWLNQHIFAVRQNGKRSKPYLHALLKFLKPEFAELARNKQTTGLGHVTKADMQRMMVCAASPEIHRAFDCLIEPIFNQALGLQTETRTLAQTRDLLLPRLMSGELRVADLATSEQEAAA